MSIDWSLRKKKAQVDKERLKQMAKNVRMERDRRLKESDWTQMPDSPVKNKEDWKRYRDLLRRVPQQSNFPEEVTWPKKP